MEIRFPQEADQLAAVIVCNPCRIAIASRLKCNSKSVVSRKGFVEADESIAHHVGVRPLLATAAIAAAGIVCGSRGRRPS